MSITTQVLLAVLVLVLVGALTVAFFAARGIRQQRRDALKDLDPSFKPYWRR